MYEYILANAGEILTPMALDVFKVSLASRSTSPAVEMFFQIARDHRQGTHCPVSFFEVAGKILCDLDALERHIATFDGSAG